MPHWRDQKIINLPRTQARHQCSENFSRLLSLHRSHQWAAWTQPHVKRPDSPERGDWSRFNPSAVLQTRRRSITLWDQNAEFTHSPSRERDKERERKEKKQRPSPGKFYTPPSSLVLRTLCFVFGNEWCIRLHSVMSELVQNKQQGALVFTS